MFFGGQSTGGFGGFDDDFGSGGHQFHFGGGGGFPGGFS